MTRKDLLLILAAAILPAVLTFVALGAGLFAGFANERKAHRVEPMKVRYVNWKGEEVRPPSGRDSTQLPNTRD
jgi:hypothetical protein